MSQRQRPVEMNEDLRDAPSGFGKFRLPSAEHQFSGSAVDGSLRTGRSPSGNNGVQRCPFDRAPHHKIDGQTISLTFRRGAMTRKGDMITSGFRELVQGEFSEITVAHLVAKGHCSRQINLLRECQER
jgi:hypothetical protein